MEDQSEIIRGLPNGTNTNDLEGHLRNDLEGHLKRCQCSRYSVKWWHLRNVATQRPHHCTNSKCRLSSVDSRHFTRP